MAKHVSHELYMKFYSHLAITGEMSLLYIEPDVEPGEAGYCVCEFGYYPTHTDCYPCD